MKVPQIESVLKFLKILLILLSYVRRYFESIKNIYVIFFYFYKHFGQVVVKCCMIISLSYVKTVQIQLMCFSIKMKSLRFFQVNLNHNNVIMSKNSIIDSYLNQFNILNFLEKVKLMNVLKVMFMTERSVLVFTMFFMCPTGCNPIEHSLLYSRPVNRAYMFSPKVDLLISAQMTFFT